MGAAGTPFLAAQTDVTTYHNDNARTGQYLTETLLTPASVQPGLFGKRFTYTVDGEVYAQPLYLSRVLIPGRGLHDVVYAATGHDSVYAFDADDPTGANAAPLWQVSFLNEAAGVTTVPSSDVNCTVIYPELGITGTPVIDAAAGTMYVIAETREPGPAYVFRLHALDVTSGAERPGSPVVIEAPGFVTAAHKHRGALLLANGTVYTSWSSHCDIGEYHGWLIAYDAATLQRTGVYNTTPQGNGASFWSGGGGPAADANGNLFVVSANGDFDANAGGTDYGDSVIKLSPNGLTVSDFFTPFNQLFLDGLDLDLGSSDAVLLPDSAGNAAHPHVLATAGKEGRVYLLDRDNLGHAQVSNDAGALAADPLFTTAILGSMAWFNGSLYVAGKNAPLESFAVSDAALNGTAIAKSSRLSGDLGAVPSISANGDRNGIAWTVTSDSVLAAFDATDLSELYDSSVQTGDELDSFVEFAVPTPANGKVYVGTIGSLSVYGALAPATPSIGAVANAASYSQKAVAPGSLVAIFGTALALNTAAAPSVPLPISLNDVSVTFNGIPAPLLYVSATQINAEVPAATPAGPVQVIVRVAGAASAPFSIPIQAAAPGIFLSAGVAAALDQDGLVNSAVHPAAAASIVSVFLTGDDDLDSNSVDGDPGSGQPASASGGTPEVVATLGGEAAALSYAGPAPGYAGLIQINMKIPALPAGVYPLVVTIDGQPSNIASLYVNGL